MDRTLEELTVKTLLSVTGNKILNMSNPGAMYPEDRHDRTVLSPRTRRFMDSIDDVVVVGAGGIGAWVAHFIAVSDIAKRLHLYDRDIIETHNHTRFLFPPEMTGHKKVHALGAMLKQSRPEANININDIDFGQADLEMLLSQIHSTRILIDHQNEGTHPCETSIIPAPHVSSLRDRIRTKRRSKEIHTERSQNTSNTQGHFKLNQYQRVMNGVHLIRPILILDTTDNIDFQKSMSELCMEKQEEYLDTFNTQVFQADTRYCHNPLPVPIYMRISYNGVDHCTITPMFSSWGDEHTLGRYDVIPSFPLPAILSAIMGIYAALQRIQLYSVEAGYRATQELIGSYLNYDFSYMSLNTCPSPAWLHFTDLYDQISELNHNKMYTLVRQNLTQAERSTILSTIMPELYPEIVLGNQAIKTTLYPEETS